MKFAKELEHELVPEWREKYLQYKLGKKKLKAIENSASRTRRRLDSVSSSRSPTLSRRAAPSEPTRRFTNDQDGPPASSPEPVNKTPVTTPDMPHEPRMGMTRYGSIIGSPPRDLTHATTIDGPPSLRLPKPAIDNDTLPQRSSPTEPPSGRRPRSPSNAATRHATFDPIAVSKRPKRSLKPFAQRIMSLRHRTSSSHSDNPPSLAMDIYRDYDMRVAEFFSFLDDELDKIDGFYKQKQQEAADRLATLRQQLHVMRDQRLSEIVAYRQAKRNRYSTLVDRLPDERDPLLLDRAKEKTREILRPLDDVWDKAKLGGVGKTFQAMKILGTPPGPTGRPGPDLTKSDYARRYNKRDHAISYKTAKHKLKAALVEYYRGLELLKSYAMVNRTAFRKINKKYDKTVIRRPAGRYMTDKVNKGAFVNNDALDANLHAVEDLYARYFEKGDRKTAIGKLRIKAHRSGEYSASAFRSGLTLAAGLVFAIQGLVKALNLLASPDPQIVTNTSYLLQIYGGYVLMLALALMFCLACRIWQQSRVHYQFIFEFDTRHSLDWRQLSQIPCLFSLLLGLFMWLNFSRYAAHAMYLYWPVILVGLSTIILFMPLPVLYPRSRSWFAKSLWRLSLAGLFPVEFRDFFLGDLFCSQTYALGNLELFFCLYAQHPIWQNPSNCNSSHSRLLGFFTALPGIWRALQCLRRYHDTRNVFPHLVNCGKYMFTILYYMSLSLYRFSPHPSLMAMFIVFASVNAIYCSAWDIVMDWSLLDPHADHRFLRPVLAFDVAWPYYLAIVVDPIIRFNWILYAVYTHNLQHSTKIAFLVGLTEVLRRGMWVIFRVENEHVANVGRFRASRDVALPYNIQQEDSHESSAHPSDEHDSGASLSKQRSHSAPGEVATSQATGADLEQSTSQAVTAGSGANVGRRKSSRPALMSTFRRVGTILRAAHAQDFERKRRPEVGAEHANKSDDEEDDDNDNMEQ